jgi:hypothetical protein
MRQILLQKLPSTPLWTMHRYSSEASTHTCLEVGLGGDFYDSSDEYSDKYSDESLNNESESEGIVTRSQRRRLTELDEGIEVHREATAHLQAIRALRDRRNELIERGNEGNS